MPFSTGLLLTSCKHTCCIRNMQTIVQVLLVEASTFTKVINQQINQRIKAFKLIKEKKLVTSI